MHTKSDAQQSKWFHSLNYKPSTHKPYGSRKVVWKGQKHDTITSKWEIMAFKRAVNILRSDDTL